MLFWHLACRQNPHIRQVCCGFAAFDQLQNSYRYTISGIEGVSLFGKFCFALLGNSPTIACEA